jgi:hypothetical protein
MYFECVVANLTTNWISNQARLTVTPAFVAVTDITGVPASATVGVPLTLTGTVAPSNATNKTIVWIVVTGSPSASISGNTFTSTTTGTFTIRAIIENGMGTGLNYGKDFNITVTAATVAPTISSHPTNQSVV